MLFFPPTWQWDVIRSQTVTLHKYTATETGRTRLYGAFPAFRSAPGCFFSRIARHGKVNGKSTGWENKRRRGKLFMAHFVILDSWRWSSKVAAGCFGWDREQAAAQLRSEISGMKWLRKEMIELWVVQNVREKCCPTNSACVMFPSQSRHYKFSICGFFLQLRPLFLSFSISLRQQSANGPVFILLQLRKKTLCFFFFTQQTIYRESLTSSTPP